MGIKKKVQDAIDQIKDSVEQAVWSAPVGPYDSAGTVDVNHIYSSGTTTGDPNSINTTDHTITIAPNSSGASSGNIWVDSSSDIVFGGDPWTTTVGNVTLSLGNMELMVTEAGETKITVTDGDDVTEYHFSKDKTRKFLEQFADVVVTGKK